MAPDSTARRLATILAADVVGYSRLMALDEEATVRTLHAHREIIDRLIARHEGRIFHTAGDSVLAEFGSAVEAVRCAITIQDELRVRNAELDDDRRMLLRIGINIGDVIVDGDDLLGDGVNVAARLEGLAAPGGVCISGGTFEQVKNKLSIGFEDLGPQAVKNIPDPVAAYRLTGAPVSVSTPPSPADTTRRRRLPTGAVVAGAVAIALVAAGLLRGRQPAMPPATPVPETAVTAPLPSTARATPPPVPATPPAEVAAASPPSNSPPAATPRPAPKASPDHVSTQELTAAQIATLLTGVTLAGTRQKDGQPFTIELHAEGVASYAFPRGGAGSGTTFRASGRWRTEDGLFCMQFRGFNEGEEACPVFVREGRRISAMRPNGEPLDWSVTRASGTASAVAVPATVRSSDEMRAAEIATLVTGTTLRGTRLRDGRPFAIALEAGGKAAITVERPDRTPFHETGRWWSEDYRFCMRFATALMGKESCPRIVSDGERLALTRGDGTPLGWTLTRSGSAKVSDAQ